MLSPDEQLPEGAVVQNGAVGLPGLAQNLFPVRHKEKSWGRTGTQCHVPVVKASYHRLARAGRPGQHQVTVLAYPAAGEQIADQRLVQAAARVQIQVLEAGRLSQTSALEPHFQSGIGAVGRFPLDQQGELIIEVEPAAVVQPRQLLQRPDHAEQAQGLELFQVGVMHGFSPGRQW